MFGSVCTLLCLVYFLEQPVALKMEIDLQTNKLWKDRALVELNVAVLHSYQVTWNGHQPLVRYSHNLSL